MTVIVKLLGTEEVVSDKKDQNGSVIGKNVYKYLHCLMTDEVQGVVGSAVTRIGIAYDADIDLDGLQLGAEYELFTYYDSQFKSRKCNGIHLLG